MQASGAARAAPVAAPPAASAWAWGREQESVADSTLGWVLRLGFQEQPVCPPLRERSPVYGLAPAFQSRVPILPDYCGNLPVSHSPPMPAPVFDSAAPRLLRVPRV